MFQKTIILNGTIRLEAGGAITFQPETIHEELLSTIIDMEFMPKKLNGRYTNIMHAITITITQGEENQ